MGQNDKRKRDLPQSDSMCRVFIILPSIILPSVVGLATGVNHAG